MLHFVHRNCKRKCGIGHQKKVKKEKGRKKEMSMNRRTKRQKNYKSPKIRGLFTWPNKDDQISVRFRPKNLSTNEP